MLSLDDIVTANRQNMEHQFSEKASNKIVKRLTFKKFVSNCFEIDQFYDV